MNKRYNFADGKYTIIRNVNTYETETLRHHEPWDRDLTGDNLIHAMLNRIDDLEEMLNEQK